MSSKYFGMNKVLMLCLLIILLLYVFLAGCSKKYDAEVINPFTEKPAINFEIEFFIPEAPEKGISKFITDENGQFVLSGLEPKKRYRVRPIDEKYLLFPEEFYTSEDREEFKGYIILKPESPGAYFIQNNTAKSLKKVKINNQKNLYPHPMAFSGRTCDFIETYFDRLPQLYSPTRILLYNEECFDDWKITKIKHFEGGHFQLNLNHLMFPRGWYLGLELVWRAKRENDTYDWGPFYIEADVYSTKTIKGFNKNISVIEIPKLPEGKYGLFSGNFEWGGKTSVIKKAFLFEFIGFEKEVVDGIINLRNSNSFEEAFNLLIKNKHLFKDLDEVHNSIAIDICLKTNNTRDAAIFLNNIYYNEVTINSNPNKKFEYAKKFRDFEDLNLSEKILRELLKEDPFKLNYQILLADVLIAKKDIKSAKVIIQQCLVRYPNNDTLKALLESVDQ